MASQIQMRFDFVGAIELSPTARLVGELLNRTRREHAECWLANKTIAARIGKSIRTVQLALKELERADLIQLTRAYWLKSRRRILLLWRGTTGPQTSPFDDTNCAQSAPEVAPSSALPPHPPIEVPEGIEVMGSVDTASEPPTTPPDLSHSESLPSQAEAKAVDLWGDTPAVRNRVRQAEREYGPAWVSQALDVCREKARTGWAVFGLARKILGEWRDLGGPPPAAVTCASTVDSPPLDEEAEAARIAAEYRAWRATHQDETD